MLNVRLFLLQRLSAILMGPMVIGHIFVMIYAVQGGLSASEILSRTQGSFLWGLFYGSFVVAISIHGAIGLRVIAFEQLKLKGAPLEALMWIIGFGLLLLGGRAVVAVVL